MTVAACVFVRSQASTGRHNRGRKTKMRDPKRSMRDSNQNGTALRGGPESWPKPIVRSFAGSEASELPMQCRHVLRRETGYRFSCVAAVATGQYGRPANYSTGCRPRVAPVVWSARRQAGPSCEGEHGNYSARLRASLHFGSVYLNTSSARRRYAGAQGRRQVRGDHTLHVPMFTR